MIQGTTSRSPRDSGYDPSRLDALDAHLLRLIDSGKLLSANYCISRDGEVFAARAHGKLSFHADEGREMRPDAIQWTASITKLFTACAVFRLVEDGIIRLCASAGSILPEMNAPPLDGITIAQLLSHASGLNPDPGCFTVAYGKSARDFVRMMPDKPWLEAGLSVGMRRPPGTEWMYSTFGYVILGEIISRASGMDCHEFIRSQVIEPCGLPDTFFPPFAPDEKERPLMAARAARMVSRDEYGQKLIKDMLGQGTVEPPSAAELRQAQMPRTGGGLWSTAADLNRFGVMLMNLGTLDGKRVLGRRTVLRMTENCTPPEIRDWCWGANGPHRDYALGPDKRRNEDSLNSESAYFHEGVGPCRLIVDPQERAVASWFTPTVDGEWIAEAVYNTAAVIWSGLE